MILFQNTLFLKEFLACNAVLGYLTKLKKGLGLAFGAHFLHDFSIKMFLIQLSINGQMDFHCYTLFLSQDIKQNVL